MVAGKLVAGFNATADAILVTELIRIIGRVIFVSSSLLTGETLFIR